MKAPGVFALLSGAWLQFPVHTKPALSHAELALSQVKAVL